MHVAGIDPQTVTPECGDLHPLVRPHLHLAVRTARYNASKLVGYSVDG